MIGYFNAIKLYYYYTYFQGTTYGFNLDIFQ